MDNAAFCGIVHQQMPSLYLVVIPPCGTNQGRASKPVNEKLSGLAGETVSTELAYLMTIFDRLKNISKAYFNHQFRRKSTESPSEGDEKSGETASGGEYQSSGSAYSSSTSSGTNTASNPYGLPQQVVDDLVLFGITPPGSWDEVIKARNREMKKYHPDKYMSKEEKVDAANEIVQIYNAAFERLEKYYENKS